MVDIFLLRVYMLQDVVCIALNSRCEHYDVKFLGEIADKLFCVVSDSIMSSSFVIVKGKRKDFFICFLIQSLRMNKSLV